MSILKERERTKPDEREQVDLELHVFEHFEASMAKQLGELRADAQRLRDVVILRSRR